MKNLVITLCFLLSLLSVIMVMWMHSTFDERVSECLVLRASSDAEIERMELLIVEANRARYLKMYRDMGFPEEVIQSAKEAEDVQGLLEPMIQGLSSGEDNQDHQDTH